MRTCRRTEQRFLHSPPHQCTSLCRHVQSWPATCFHSWRRLGTSILAGFSSGERLTCFCSQQGRSPYPWSTAVEAAGFACILRFFAPACSCRKFLAWRFLSIANLHQCRNSSAPRLLVSHSVRRLACFASNLERVSSRVYGPVPISMRPGS